MNKSQILPSRRNLFQLFVICVLFLSLLSGCQGGQKDTLKHIAVLVSGSIRSETVNGFLDGMADLGWVEGQDFVAEIYTADGDHDELVDLAQQIVESLPDVAIAAGGIEADSLKLATMESQIPVVFLAVSSAVERGLVASRRSSGNNLTGVDTNDADLTAKRLELISQILPEAKRVLMLNVPGNTPSMKAVESARQVATSLGVTLSVVDVESEAEIVAVAAQIRSEDIDAILLFLERSSGSI